MSLFRARALPLSPAPALVSLIFFVLFWGSKTGVRSGKDKIREYFVGFLETNYDTVLPNFPPTIEEADLQQLGPGVVSYSGYYTFDLSKGTTNKVANAKFTYIYKRGRDGKLKILLHNSGFTPAGAVAK